MKTLTLTPLFLLVMVYQVKAQEKLGLYFPAAGDAAGKNNVEMLIDNFLQPLGQDICILPNNGWYTTAKTHKKWGFDLSVTVNSVFVSNDKKTYGFPSLNGLQFLGTTEGGQGGVGSAVPTAYGRESDHPEFLITSGPNSDITFRGPDGFDPGAEYFIDAQPIYTIQAGLGVFKNTDLRLRFTPKTTISSVSVGNWGVGIMHDLKQHVIDNPESNFSLSLFLGFTQVNGTVDLSGIYSGSGQEAKVQASGFTGQVVAGYAIKIISFYGALGYDTGNSKIDINGTYNVNEYVDEFGDKVPLTSPFTLTNPFNYEYDQSGLRFTLGMRLKFGPVTLNGDYSLVGSNRVLSLGFGITVN